MDKRFTIPFWTKRASPRISGRSDPRRGFGRRRNPGAFKQDLVSCQNLRRSSGDGLSQDFVLGPSDVHLWTIDLEQSVQCITRLLEWLSGDERARAARFHFDPERNRFICGRAALRQLLGRYLQEPVTRLEFRYGPYGKPFLGGRLTDQPVSFNVSHSEGLAQIAIGRCPLLGVDVERARDLAESDDLVQRFFSPRESALFRQLSPSERPLAFFNLWTRKEAWLKATGEGIAHYLNRVEVTFRPGEPPRLLSCPERFGVPGNWNLIDVTPAPGFVGTVAIATNRPRLSQRSWDLNQPT